MKPRFPFTMLTALSVFVPMLSFADSGFGVRQEADRLTITHAGGPVADFVFRDDRILRPYFANLHAPGGLRVTRNHPPVEGADAVDHDTMHPGLWLAFGDINGVDFWRNKGRIQQVRFLEPPIVEQSRLRFATECRLLAPSGEALGSVTNRFELSSRAGGWLVVWEALFRSDAGPLAFGDQEEMGFGVRVATAITEKNGGQIRNSAGQGTARTTWGQPAAWCDYSGVIGERRAGVLLMADPANFRASWWHNRNYGLMVANPFGREAMRQGPQSSILVPRGETFRVRFAALAYDAEPDEELDAAAVFREFAGEGVSPKPDRSSDTPRPDGKRPVIPPMSDPFQ
jgi:hypothetical protein